MYHFQIHFAYPWLLLLLIPAVVLTFIPFFRLSKKYRKNRNRIISLVCHLVIMFLCVTLLSGMTFSYEIDNAGNEIILVVDASYSTEEERQAKDEYIKDVLSLADPDVYKIGIVTFGFDQQYAAPLTNDFTDAYNNYINATEPDTCATDIAAALTYANKFFTRPETAKLILISDGIETDEKAIGAIRAITAAGTRIDAVTCSTRLPEEEVQITNVNLPQYSIGEGENFSLELTLKSSYVEKNGATVTVFDNDAECGSTSVNLVGTEQTVTLEHSFEEKGMHILRFKLTSAKDGTEQNNEYYVYYNLENFDKVLILESYTGQSEHLKETLEDFAVTVLDIQAESVPKTLDGLRAYDQIILNNIAYSDMPEGFEKLLNDYVYEIGGGLFTVGGSEEGDPETAHAYNREDMANSLYYQQMLPVQAINYTPPLGVVLIIDVSGSMGSRLEAAKDAANSIVKDDTCLTERDYCGIMTLSDKYTQETNMLPMTRQNEILSAIENLPKGGSTLFAPALDYANSQLTTLYQNGIIEKMHVIVITDGGASDYDNYVAKMQEGYAKGVTYTFVAVDATGGNYMSSLQAAAEIVNGNVIESTNSDLTQDLKDDIRTPEIKEIEYGEFVPSVKKGSYYDTVVGESQMPKLYGFYGTKARSDSVVMLYGEYSVPIYAQWKYGKGTVGSFMCDLSGGDWSGEFMADETGKTLLNAIIAKIMPTESVRPKEIEVQLKQENFTTRLSIYPVTELEADESISVNVEHIVFPDLSLSVVPPSAQEGYSRASFITPEAGIYRITVTKMKGKEARAAYTLYTAFSYSSEYDLLSAHGDRIALMETIATSGSGTASMLENAEPYDAFEGFKTTLDRSYDPRLPFLITAIVLFLLDIAVRKFKFKWIHEIVRERKEKKLR